MKNQIHLLETDEPLQWPTSIKVRCEIILQSAHPVWMFRHDFKPSDLWLEGFTSLQVCQRCLDNPPNTADEKRDYLYGLVEAPDEFHTPELEVEIRRVCDALGMDAENEL